MKLLEPISIGTMTLRNRMVMSAMHTCLCDGNGFVTDQLIAYYARRAEGGLGLITMEAAAVHRLGRKGRLYCRIDGDEYIDGVSRLAAAVKTRGAKFSVQLWHAGHAANPAAIGEEAVGPSPVAGFGFRHVPRALSAGEIEEIVECYGEGARRAREAGADGLEVHAGHGYLIAQFLSPLYNKRTDAYGGDLRNRARFGLQVATRIRERVGRDFPLVFKLSAWEHREGGFTPEEIKVVAQWLEQAGVDAVVVSSGGQIPSCWQVPPMMLPRGYHVHFAQEFKSVLRIPVGTIARINDPAFAEQVLQEGKADYVNLGRATIADPDFARKVAEGRSDEVRHCTACRYCVETSSTGQVVRCMVNAEVGRELEWTLERAKQPKKVLVVGGGPGGLEAARVAAMRGHRVTLCEQENYLGGMSALGSVPPSKYELLGIAEHYTGELERHGVEVRMGQKVTPALVEELAPEAVVLATGSLAVTPRIAGIEQENVLHARDVLAGKVTVGSSAVIVGGGSVGCEVAEHLRHRGVEVTMLEMMDDFAKDMEPETRDLFLEELGRVDVRMVSRAKVLSFDGTTVTYSNESGEEIKVTGESIILAVGSRPNSELVEFLKSRQIAFQMAGDCVRVRRIPEAVYEGALAARNI